MIKSKSQFIRVECDVTIDHIHHGASYRLWLHGQNCGDQLIAERTWYHTKHHYVTESLQLQLSPGAYSVSVHKVKPCKSKFTLSNYKVKIGNGRFINNSATFEVSA